MILNSKQLEELESIHDSVVEFEEDAATTDNDNFDEGAESTLAWRRSMIEKAAANVKKAHKKAIDPQAPYTLGALLFDRATKRFARVESSAPGSLQVIYLSGGANSIRQNQNHLAFEEISEGHSAAPTAKSKSKAAAKKKAPAKTKLKNQETLKKETIEIRDMKAVKSLIADQASAAKKKPVLAQKVEAKPTAKPTQKPAAKPATKATLKTVTKTKAPQKIVKPALKKTGKATPDKKKPLVKSHKPAAKPAKKTVKQKAASHTQHLAISDPVADPNGYIKQYFRLMSNKELAIVTGLSEHTIRRKLGEWGLKRPSKAK